MQNPLSDLKTRFFRSKQQPPSTDPQLEAIFQQILAQFPPEQLKTSEGQLRAVYRMSLEAGKLEGEKHVTLQSSTLLCPVCNRTVMTLYPTKVPHRFIQVCDQCEKRSQTQPEAQQKPNPWQIHLDEMQQKKFTQDMLIQRRVREMEKIIAEDKPTGELSPIPPRLAHEIQQANGVVESPGILIEDQWLLNSTPVELPTVEETEGETETGLPAFAAYLKHVSKRTA